MNHASLFSGIGGCGVYEIIHTITGRSYIGSSSNIRKRITAHISLLRNNKHPNIKLQRAFNKYGESNFSFKIISLTNENKLIEEEAKQVNIMRPYFNLREVVESNRGIKLSENTKQKMSLARKGKPLSQSQLENIRKLHRARINKPVTGKTKESLRLGPLSRIGKPVSEETREKIRQSKIGRRFNPNTRKYEKCN